MGQGLSVDFSVHVSLAVEENYNDAKRLGHTPSMHDAVVDTLATMGVSVLKGGFTTLLGILVIGFANSVAFRVFFTMLSGVVLLGVFHALTLLPIAIKWATWPRLAESC